MAQTVTTDELLNQIKKNSQAWHQADPTQQEWLHSQNKMLYAVLDGQEGSTSTFDSGTGTWSTTPGTQSGSATNQANGGGDYTKYINEMYGAQEDATLAALELAYQQQLQGLHLESQGLGDQYQQARNTTAGVNQMYSKNFNEYATARGLNSGTTGQAELAQNLTLQNQISKLTQEEAAAYQAIQSKQAALTAEYQTAVATAKAKGQTALAEALYKEWSKRNS